MLDFQKQIISIKKTKTNSFFKSNYFDINDLLEAVRPPLSEAGIVLVQGLTELNGKLALATTLFNSDDQTQHIGFVCPLPETTDAQKAGSAITYFRRYALQALLGLEAEDDDGNSASATSKAVVKAPKPVASTVNVDEPPFEDAPAPAPEPVTKPKRR